MTVSVSLYQVRINQEKFRCLSFVMLLANTSSIASAYRMLLGIPYHIHTREWAQMVCEFANRTQIGIRACFVKGVWCCDGDCHSMFVFVFRLVQFTVYAVSNSDGSSSSSKRISIYSIVLSLFFVFFYRRFNYERQEAKASQIFIHWAHSSICRIIHSFRSLTQSTVESQCSHDHDNY